MLNIPGSEYRLCDGLSRRNFLRIGGLGTAGLTLPDLFRAQARGPDSSGDRPGKARSCIFIFLQGGPSHLETFDLKPDAPAEIRGEFRPIATNVPGISIGEHFPLLARHADKCAIVRSVHNNGMVTNQHGDALYLTVTGHRHPQQIPDSLRPSQVKPDHHPFIGSAISYLRPATNALPSCVYFDPQRVNSGVGQRASFLGQHHDPFMVEQNPNAPSFTVEALAPPADVSSSRLADRSRLLKQIDLTKEALRSGAAAQLDAHYQKALNLLRTTLATRAFDIAAEPAKLRDRYRRHMFGQSALLARRLVEHGVPLVTVRWNGGPELPLGGWDMHQTLHRDCKVLLPILDQVLSALLEDLSVRGLLEETLVVVTGEFGRTPKIDPNGAGRHHWGHCYSVLVAGGGIRGGQIYGASDAHGAYPREKPVGTSDVVATMYQCLGVRPDIEVPNREGRMVRLCEGQAIQGLFA